MQMVTDDEKIQERRKEYFEGLLNKDNSRDYHEATPCVTPTQGIGREVVRALKRIRNKKATGPDKIALEAWMALGEEGVD